MLHLLDAVKRQLTICFKSLKPIQIGLFMLMSSSIHLHGSRLDAQYGQTWHLSTQLHSGKRTSCRLLWSTTLVTDSTIQQPGFDLPRHTWSLMNRFRTGQGPCRANLHKWGLAQSPFGDCGSTRARNKIWRWAESTPQSGWWCSHISEIYSDCSTRKIIIFSSQC